MAFNCYTNFNQLNNPSNPQFRGKLSDIQILNKPIEQIGNVINNTVDTFIPQTSQETENTEETEKKKKSKKYAITALSSVLVVSGIVALFNPSFSNKLLSKIDKIAAKSKSKAQANLTLKDKIYLTFSNGLTEMSKNMQFINTANATKDVLFTKLCKSNKFGRVKNNFIRNILQTIDNCFTKVMSKAHNGITKMFDYVSKKTVYTKYGKVNNSFDSLDHTLGMYRSKLPKSERIKFDKKFEEIIQARSYFRKDETSKRLLAQQQMMSNIQDDFSKRLNNFVDGFEGGIKSPIKFCKNWEHNAKHFDANRSFWAEEIVAPQKEIVEKQGTSAVNKLVGDGKTEIGKYGELLDILSPHIRKEEKAILEEYINSAGKKLRKANKSECFEYFDKKRDLMLGGAPTDIVTAATTLGVSGVLIGTSDSKEDRISRTLTMVIPALSGVGVSFAMASALFAGTTSLLSGAISSVVLSNLGSLADKHFVQKNSNSKEVKND